MLAEPRWLRTDPGVLIALCMRMLMWLRTIRLSLARLGSIGLNKLNGLSKLNGANVMAAVGLVVLAGGLSGSARAANDDAQRVANPEVRLEREFVRAADLQVHYRMAYPVNFKHEQSRPVVALHQSPNSSQVYVEFMAELARDRRVYAPDTPGYGDSQGTREQPGIGDYANFMIAFADELGLQEFDLVGYHTGASIAVQWALQDQQRIQNLLLVGVPLLSDEQREGLAQNRWPQPQPIDGAMLQREWESSKKWQGNGQSDRSVERTFLAKIEAGQTAWWGPAAVAGYRLEHTLPRLQQRVTVVNPRDDLWETTPRARKLLPDAAYIELPDYGFGLWEAIPQPMADIARQAFAP